MRVVCIYSPHLSSSLGVTAAVVMTALVIRRGSAEYDALFSRQSMVDISPSGAGPRRVRRAHADVSWLFTQPPALEQSEGGHAVLAADKTFENDDSSDDADADAEEGGDGDWLELDLALAETASLQARPGTSTREKIESAFLVRQCPTSPPRDAANSSFSTAMETLRRRWARMRSQPCTFADLPEELYSLISPHVACAALAPLALVSTAWSTTCAKLFASQEFWEYRAQLSQVNSLLPHTFLQMCQWSTDALRLLGALTCRCTGPADVLILLRAARSAAAEGSDFADGLTYHGAEGLGEQLVKCGHPQEWTRELVLEVILLYTDADVVLDLEDADCMVMETMALLSGMRSRSALSRGFSVAEPELFELLHARVTARETRSRIVMERFASFADDYDFGDAEAAQIGTFAAAAKLPIDDMCAVPRAPNGPARVTAGHSTNHMCMHMLHVTCTCACTCTCHVPRVLNLSHHSIDLVAKLGNEEAQAENDWLETQGHEATCATLRCWAAASNFSSAWLEVDVLAAALALRTLTVAWGDDFKNRLTPLVLGWARPLLGEPHQLALRMATSLIDVVLCRGTVALQGELLRRWSRDYHVYIRESWHVACIDLWFGVACKVIDPSSIPLV